MEETYQTCNSLPSQGQAFQEFLRTYPLYLDTLVVDHIREQEYPHLNERSIVCLDYMGVGLFSHSQQSSNPHSAALGLAYISVNLATHALYTVEETELMVRRRVLRYMNIDENEYAIVFTANKLSAFKLLGESYPFHISSKLLLGYDHQCDSQDALSECAKSKGATVMSANLSWPSLKLDKADVKKKLLMKRKGLKSKGWGFHSGPLRQGLPDGVTGGDFPPNHQLPIGTQGLMVYPVMSCGSGAKNSLQWIREAGQNGWHVLLDVSGLGAKAMDTLGLNLFHPDFIVGSFYKVFGSDPTGFGCLVIRKSVIRILGDSSRARAIGMVRIVSTAGTLQSGSPKGSFPSAGRTWNPMRSTSSSDVFQSSPSMKINHHSLSDEMRGPASSNEEDSLNAQFEERFSTGGPQLHLQKIAEPLCPVGTPKKPSLRGQESVHIVPLKDAWKEDDLVKRSWVRSQSSPSFSFERHFENTSTTKFTTSLGGAEDFRQATIQAEEEIVELTKPSRSYWRYYSEEQTKGVQNSDLKGQSDQVTGWREEVAPRFGKAKEPMTGLRYLQIPNLGWDEKSIVEEENFLSRDFGKKSPLMLTLPKGFDSPCIRTPPFSKHEAHQEFLVGSIPDTPSSVSAPCSPRYPCLFDQDEEIRSNPDPHVDPPGTIICRGLDLADKIGITRINFRLRALINWLISSLRKLRHPVEAQPHVVLIYGPLCQNDRSSTFTFNVASSDGRLLSPVLVQRLADRSSIALGTSTIQGSFTLDEEEDTQKASKRGSEPKKFGKCGKCRASKAGSKSGSNASSPKGIDLARQKWNSKNDIVHTGKFPVLCASLCFLSTFTDVYRLWEFIALFLNSDFVNRELFHYRALNQQTILM